MKNIIAFIFIGLLVTSCGSTKEIETEEPEEEVVEVVEMRKPNEMPKSSLRPDPEQIAAQIGLSESQEAEFLNLWYSTAESMRLVRVEHRRDKDVFKAKMKEVKDERAEGLKSISTKQQLTDYYRTMERYRNNLNPKIIKRRGN